MLQDLKQIKTDEYKQKNPNGLLPAVKIEGEFYYESGAIMQIILEKFSTGTLMPAPNTKQRGARYICMPGTPVCLLPCTYASHHICIYWFKYCCRGSVCAINVAVCMKEPWLDSGKFLQWMWFLEATFTPHLSELHHHKMVLPDDKKVPEVHIAHVLDSAHAV